MGTAANLRRSGNKSEREKVIAAYTMLKLPVDQYFQFCDRVFRGFEAKKVSVDVMEYSIFPIYNFSTKTAENYQRDDVKALLQKIREELVRRNEMKLVGYVDRVLSGQTAADVKKMRDMGQLS